MIINNLTIKNKMELNELKIICNALYIYKRYCTERAGEPPYDNRKDVGKIERKYEEKLHNKTKRGYLVIRGSWSGYSGQSNCYKGERRSRCKKISASQFKFNNIYTQYFDDGTCNYWTINFVYDKPHVNNNLGGYEWRLRKQGLPV